MLCLRRLDPSDGEEIYIMLQEIARDDNGFRNKANGMTFDEYKAWLTKEYAVDCGKLEDWMVPQSSYWLCDDNRPVGYGRIRHYLNDALRENSGHIGITEVQISAREDNIPSNKVIVRNGGILQRMTNGKFFYKIFLE